MLKIFEKAGENMVDKIDSECVPVIWRARKNGLIFIGDVILEELPPLQKNILSYFIDNPFCYLTKTSIITASWIDVTVRDGVTDAALHKQISDLRRKIRTFSEYEYIETWRGAPEGGYRFFPGELSNFIETQDFQIPFLWDELDSLVMMLSDHRNTLNQLEAQLKILTDYWI